MSAPVEVSRVEPRTSPLAGAREWRSLLTLMRREFWEHRILWMAPLAVAVLLVIGAAFGRAEMLRVMPVGRIVLTPQMGRALFAVSMLGLGLTEYVTMSLVLWYYAADCLYAERRDRSILFWKSMPVSDGETVLAKALVALVAVPLAVYLVTAATTVITSGIWSIRGWSGYAGPLFWDTGTWLRLEAVTFLGLVIASLWYAPITAYLMLVSSLVRRNAQLWVFLPPIVAMLVEHFTFGTHYLFTVLVYRLQGGWQSDIVAYVQRLFTGQNLSPDAASLSPTPNPLEFMDPMRAFANVDLWIGLAVAIVIFYAAARIRRYRDET